MKCRSSGNVCFAFVLIQFIQDQKETGDCKHTCRKSQIYS